MANEVDAGAGAGVVVPFRPPTSLSSVHQEAEAILSVLGSRDAARLDIIQRRQHIWPNLPNEHREYLRREVSTTFAISPSRFDFLIECESPNTMRAALAWQPEPPPRLQDDERMWLEFPGFIKDFVEWSYRSRCPVPSLGRAAMSCLGVAARRNFYVPVGLNDFIYPNLFLLFEGDSGTGKSYAIKAAKNILKLMNEILDRRDGTPRKVHILSGKTTLAALEETLTKVCRQRVYAPIKLNDHPDHYETCEIGRAHV